MESDAVLSTSLSQGAILQVLSCLPQLQQTPPITKYSYLVKFIQAQKKSAFTVRMWHDADEKFTSLTNLRMNLMDYFHDELPTPSFKLGYYEAPHNTKRWLWSNVTYRQCTNHLVSVPESLCGVKPR